MVRTVTTVATGWNTASIAPESPMRIIAANTLRVDFGHVAGADKIQSATVFMTTCITTIFVSVFGRATFVIK